MRSPRRFRYHLLTGVLLLSASSIAQLAPSDIISIWLQTDCLEGDDGSFTTKLVQARTTVEPALIAAAQNGPDSNTLLLVATTAGTEFDAVQAWIVPNGAEIGLSSDGIALVQSQSRDQFVAQVVHDTTITYQSRALGGLGVIGDSTAIQVLQSYANDNSSPLQSVAAQILAGDFATFSGKLEISRGFELKASFSLRTNSDGISPVTEAVTLQIGTFVADIPSGSFKANENGSFTFEGIINGAKLELQIKPLPGSYSFSAESSAVNLTALKNPVTVALSIGNDRGSITVRADR